VSRSSLRNFVLLITSGIVIGCGDTTPGVSVDVIPTNQSTSGVDGAGVDSSSPKPVDRRSDEVWEDNEGRKYLGRVPYDVFFDHPLEVALEGQIAESRLTPTTTEVAAAVPPDNTMPSADLAGSSADPQGGVDWALQLPVDVLESEVKSARNFLKEKLRSVASYNSAVTMIPVRAAMIAVLAGIAAEHTGDISWKDDALYVRDLARNMNESVLKRGPKDQRRLLRLFEDLADTLNRSRPAGLKEPSTEVTLSDAAGMGMIMLRIEESEQRLRTEVTDGGFQSQSQMVKHEASLTAGLMHTIGQESYGYSGDPDFLAHAGRLIEAAQEMRDAAEAGEFAEFELSLTRASGACQSCHRDYRSN
jgi:hypothetical protein